MMRIVPPVSPQLGWVEHSIERMPHVLLSPRNLRQIFRIEAVSRGGTRFSLNPASSSVSIACSIDGELDADRRAVGIEIQPRFERSGEDSVAKEARAASVRWNVRPNGGETGGTILITSLLPPSLTHLSQHDRVVHKMVLRLVTQIVALCGVGVAAIARKSALAQLRVLLVKSLLYLGPALLLLALWLATPSCTWPSIPSSRRLSSLLLLLLTRSHASATDEQHSRGPSTLWKPPPTGRRDCLAASMALAYRSHARHSCTLLRRWNPWSS